MAALVLFVGVSVARAGLPADADALVYTGVLEQDGVLLNDDDTALRVEIFDVDTGGVPVCFAQDTSAEVQNGHFRMPLPTCPAAMRDAQNVFVEVKVNGVTVGGRVRVGAVPFALEAGIAEVAEAAEVAGAVGAGGVDAAALATNAVTNPAIADGAVTTPKLAANAVGGAQIADGQVGSADIADGSVGTAELGDGAVTTAKVAVNAIGGLQIGDGQVGSADIADGTVGANELAVGAAATNLSIRRVACTPTSGFTDCSCAANEFVIGGGGMTFQPLNYIRESQPVGDRTWRVACKDTNNNDQNCVNVTALCVRIAP